MIDKVGEETAESRDRSQGKRFRKMGVLAMSGAAECCHSDKTAIWHLGRLL